MQLHEIDTEVWTIPDFLTEQECQELILMSEQIGYEKAKVNIDGRQVNMPNVRDNERVLHFSDELSQRIWEKIKPFAPTPGNHIPIGLNELWRFYRYHPGMRFKMHRDGSYNRGNGEASLYTLIIYLNDSFEGGETSFLNVVVPPKTGTALIFEHPIRHAGLPTSSGVKYVLRSDIMYQLNFND